MNKYYGKIGFAEVVEDKNEPGVWVERMTEKPYSGDILKNRRRLEGSEFLHDNVNVSNQFSILSDPYALNHFHSMRYLTWCGTKWKIVNVQVEYPRLILDISGVYNDGER